MSREKSSAALAERQSGPGPLLVQEPAPTENLLTVFERLAKDPSVDVQKLGQLMDLHERALARTSQEAFNAAMSAAQREMRPIAADAENPQTRSRYASYAALDRVLRPIYTDHGFALSFDTEPSAADMVRVLCYVSHTAGHARTYRVDMPADGKGAKGGDVMTKTHAAGSAMSYGMRYLLKLIFNVAVGEADDDGNRASEARPAPPKGFQDWFDDMATVADEGTTAMEAAWKASKNEFRVYVFKYLRSEWTDLKRKAAKAS